MDHKEAKEIAEFYTWHRIKSATDIPLNTRIMVCHSEFDVDFGNELPISAFYKTLEEAKEEWMFYQFRYWRHN